MQLKFGFEFIAIRVNNMPSISEPVSVLLVEDQEITRLGLVLSFKESKLVKVVGEAADGLSAIEQTKLLGPQVVLMDIGLPQMNGVDAAKHIKAELPSTRIIMFTSHDNAEHVFAALAAGTEGYCLKSISVEQLERAIVAVSEGVVWLDPGIADVVLQHLVPPGKADDNKHINLRKPRLDLSAREIEVLGLLVEGMTNQEMSQRLVVGIETIKTHMRHIMEKLEVSDRTQAAVKALKLDLV